MMNKEWSEDEITSLKELHTQKVVYSEIGKYITEKYGITRSRNSIIGMANRLGLPKREQKPKEKDSNTKPYVKRDRNKFWNDGQHAKPAPIRFNIGEGITILELKEKSCRYPTDDANRLYCGKMAEFKSYCLHHAECCYQGTTLKS